MNIVICGSVTRSKEEILHVQRILNSMFPKANVTTPVGYGRERLPLIAAQTQYVKALHDADLVIIVPKYISAAGEGGTEIRMDIGESTSYEMAMARYKMTPTVFWPNFNDFSEKETEDARLMNTIKRVTEEVAKKS